MRKINKGITLIALVITIVILLILAGISINLLVGDNGIIKKAQKSKKDTIIAAEKEAISMAITTTDIEYYGEDSGYEDFENELQQEIKNEGYDNTITYDEEGNYDFIITMTKSKNKYGIYFDDDNGYNIELIPAQTEEMPLPDVDSNIEPKDNIVDIKFNGDHELYTIMEDNSIVMGYSANNDWTEISEYESAYSLNNSACYKVFDNSDNIKYFEDGYYIDNNDNLVITNPDVVYKGELVGKTIKKMYSQFAIDTDGKVYVWGYNHRGYLGSGDDKSVSEPKCISNSGALLNKKIVEIIQSSEATFALDDQGEVFSWGYNECGELGNGTTERTSTYSPQNISTTGALKGKNIKRIISLGSTIFAIDIDGKVYGWGYNYDGNVGNGTTTGHILTPQSISDTGALVGKNIKDIQYEGAIFATDTEGNMYSWGNNEDGQAGCGSTTKYITRPVCINNTGALYGVTIDKIYHEFYPSTIYALDTTGKLYSWGDNQYGQVGCGSTKDITSPICISNTGALQNKKIKEIKFSYYHTVYVLDTEGNLYSWGNNQDGQVGCGSTDNITSPICINNIGVLQGKKIKQLYEQYGSVIALATNGNLYSWGENSNASLGNGTSENCLSPKCILSGRNITYFDRSSGIYSFEAINNKGYIYAWGKDLSTPRCLNTDSTNFLYNNGIKKIYNGDYYLTTDNKIIVRDQCYPQ